MKKIMTTIILTTVTIILAISAFLMNEDCLRVTKVEEQHNKQVILDGNVVEDTTWMEFMGYKITLNFNDGVYLYK